MFLFLGLFFIKSNGKSFFQYIFLQTLQKKKQKQKHRYREVMFTSKDTPCDHYLYYIFLFITNCCILNYDFIDVIFYYTSQQAVPILHDVYIRWSNSGNTRAKKLKLWSLAFRWHVYKLAYEDSMFNLHPNVARK